MSCDDKGCAPFPLVRDWQLVERCDSKSFGKGKTYSAEFRSIDATKQGRIGYIRALKLVGVVKVDPLDGGAPDNDIVTNHMLLSLFRSIQLSDVEGWNYLQGLDGRSIADLDFYANARFRTRRPKGAAINADIAVGVNLKLELMIDLVSLARGVDARERLLSVAAMQDRAAEAFKVKIGSAIPNQDGLVVEGYYETDGTTPGFELWADVVYLDASTVITPARWGHRNYEKFSKSGSLDFPEATHLAVVLRSFEEDADARLGEDIPSAIDDITVSVGGQQALSAVSAVELAQRNQYIKEDEADSAAASIVPLKDYDLPDTGPAGNGGVRDVMLLPPRYRKTAPAGRITYSFGVNPAGKFRVLHSFIMCQIPDRERAIKDAIGIKGGARVQGSDMGPVEVASGYVDRTGPVITVGGTTK